ncbi:hypothetical protein D9M70_444020 [compost metagenome]
MLRAVLREQAQQAHAALVVVVGVPQLLPRLVGYQRRLQAAEGEIVPLPAVADRQFVMGAPEEPGIPGRLAGQQHAVVLLGQRAAQGGKDGIRKRRRLVPDDQQPLAVPAGHLVRGLLVRGLRLDEPGVLEADDAHGCVGQDFNVLGNPAVRPAPDALDRDADLLPQRHLELIHVVGGQQGDGLRMAEQVPQHHVGDAGGLAGAVAGRHRGARARHGNRAVQLNLLRGRLDALHLDSEPHDVAGILGTERQPTRVFV